MLELPETTSIAKSPFSSLIENTKSINTNNIINETNNNNNININETLSISQSNHNQQNPTSNLIKNNTITIQYDHIDHNYNQNTQSTPQTKAATSDTTHSLSSMPSCLRHLDFIRERKFSVQVGIVYAIFMLIFIIAIGIAKVIQINGLLQTQADKNYYTSVITEMIDIQRNVKIQLDKVNNDFFMNGVFNPLLFLRIYTELIKPIDFKWSNEIISNEYLKTYNVEPLNKKANFTVKFDSTEGESKLFPFYYHFIPVIFQSLDLQGIPLQSAYFIINDIKNEDNNNIGGIGNTGTQNNYFKYPLENIDSDILTSSQPDNYSPYDFILDPVAKSFTMQMPPIDEEMGGGPSPDDTAPPPKGKMDIAKELNWYKPLHDIDFQLGITRLLRLSQDNKRDEYLMAYYKFTIDNKEPCLIAFKILHQNISIPFLSLDKNGDIYKFHTFNLITCPKKTNPTQINLTDGIYNIDYNIDDHNTILLNQPKFIDNIFKYAMLPNSILRSSSTLNQDETIPNLNINTLMLKYSEMEFLKNEYTTNFYFEHDANFFRLVVFLNNYLLYFKNGGNNQPLTQTHHPCYFNKETIDDYYKSISSNVNCFNDYCFYNNCDMTSELYIEPEKVNFMPNCYCIPLYCRDVYSSEDSLFHKEITKKLNLNKKQNDYAYTETKSQNNPNIYYNQLLNEYYNNKTHEFKCKISFIQKNEGKYNETFNIMVSLRDLTFDMESSQFIMFFMSNNDIEAIMNKFKEVVHEIKWLIYLVYFFFLTIAAVLLTVYLIYQVNGLTKRMNDIKELRKNIISTSNSNNIHGKHLNINNEDTNEKNRLLINNNNDNNNKSKGKQKEENETKYEHDELFALRTLIQDNINDFKIEFNMNENINESINMIEKQYNEIIKVNSYKNKLLPPISDKKRNKNNIINNGLSDLINNEVNDKSNTSENERTSMDSEDVEIDDLSLKIYYELLALSTEEIDFSKTKTNFYYKDDITQSIFNIDNILNINDKTDNSNNSEITNPQKLANAVNYYKNQIHAYWKKQYDELKKTDDV